MPRLRSAARGIGAFGGAFGGVFFIAGCAGLLGPAAELRVIGDDQCGALTGEVVFHRSAAWSLEAGGRTVAGGSRSERGQLPFRFAMEPGDTEVVLKVDGEEVERQFVGLVALPPVTMSLEPAVSQFPIDRPPAWTVSLVAPCSLVGPLELYAAWDGQAASKQTIHQARPASIPAAPASVGAHQLILELQTPGGAVVTRSEIPILIGPPCVDRDGDGVMSCEGDCDDNNAQVHPGATDRPGDRVDQDCDGVDGADADGDGHLSTRTGGKDCDDNNPNVGPEREEQPTPNGIDDNCDGRIDEGTVAYDDDGDGLSELQGDCDDGDKSTFPGAPEKADCIDQDCDGEVDEGLTRPQVDDAFEANDQQSAAYDLETRDRKSFARDLQVVTRGAGDEEWFRFWSDDGDWDLWGISAGVAQVPAGASYRFDVIESSGTVRSSVTVRGRADRIGVGGRWGRNDSGYYHLRVVPVEVPRPWCPLLISLSSG